MANTQFSYDLFFLSYISTWHLLTRQLAHHLRDFGGLWFRGLFTNSTQAKCLICKDIIFMWFIMNFWWHFECKKLFFHLLLYEMVAYYAFIIMWFFPLHSLHKKNDCIIIDCHVLFCRIDSCRGPMWPRILLPWGFSETRWESLPNGLLLWASHSGSSTVPERDILQYNRANCCGRV